MPITKPKGTYDVLPTDVWKWNRLEMVIKKVCRLYNFKEIRTPIFEASELFHRTVGETSDMVTKETYDFLDRGGRSNTLRPEGTAGVARSFIENKLYAEILRLADLRFKAMDYLDGFYYLKKKEQSKSKYNINAKIKEESSEGIMKILKDLAK